ncbi:MAG: glycosyltransferase [Terriglobia bacterium]
MYILRDFLLICACCSFAYYALAVISGFLFSRRARKLPSSPRPTPGVALLKPLHGCDDDLLLNLKSFMELDTGGAAMEYVFGVAHENDPALKVIEEIRRLYPAARITVTVGDEPSANRKVGKLLRILQAPISSEILVMSDADVRVSRDYLWRILGELEGDPNVGMATCAYKGIAPAGGLGARLESLFINTDFTPTAILSCYLEPMRHAFAATVALRRSTLEAAGGLDTVKNAYGDDFALARRVAALGYEIRLSSSIVTMVCEKLTFREFWRRQMRWARVDRKIRPVSLGRMLINGPFWALLVLLTPGLSIAGAVIAAIALGARLGMAAWTYRRVLQLPVRLSDLLLTLLKDLLMQAVWISSLVGDTVEWRGRKLRLLETGEMEEV